MVQEEETSEDLQGERSALRCWPFLCSAGKGRFFVPACVLNASSGAAVKTGRRPPPEAARSGIDGREHGAMLGWIAGTNSYLVLPGHGSFRGQRCRRNMADGSWRRCVPSAVIQKEPTLKGAR